MDINITLIPECDSVFLINDRLMDEVSFYTNENTVTYVTILPLNAVFLPYTVKLVGSAIVSNQSLALSCKISENEYALRLGNRQHVYSPLHVSLSDDVCIRFFYLVKGKHLSFASELMSDSLKAGLGDSELTTFFDAFSDMINYKGRYYAVDKQGVGHYCAFCIADGKIDDVSIE